MVMISVGIADRFAVPNLKKSYAMIPHVLYIPHLVRILLDSYRWFHAAVLRTLLYDISPHIVRASCRAIV